MAAASDCDAYTLSWLEREWCVRKGALAAGLGAPLASFDPGAGPHRFAPPPPPRLAGALGGGCEAVVVGCAPALARLAAALAPAAPRPPPPGAASAAFDELRAVAGDGRGAGVASFWRCLAALARPPPPLSRGRHADAAAACRCYLEEGFVAHMEGVVARHPGGRANAPQPDGQPHTPRAALVAAFLRATLPSPPGGGGEDAPPPPAWAEAFFAFRAGYVAEAAAAARRARASSGHTPVGGSHASAMSSVPAALERAAAGGGAQAGEPRALASEAAAASREPLPFAHRGGGGGAALGRACHSALAAVLSGDVDSVCASQAAHPELFPTIEDWLWHRLAGVTAGGCGGDDAGAKLCALQAVLSSFPPSHFSHGGSAPLLAATVMLLSCRPGAALAYLGGAAEAASFAGDALAASAVVASSPPLLAGLGGEAQHAVGASAAGVLVAGARALAGHHPVISAHLFLLAGPPAAAAQAAGEAPPPRGAAEDASRAGLCELLRVPGAADALLGRDPGEPGAPPPPPAPVAPPPLVALFGAGDALRSLLSAAAGEAAGAGDGSCAASLFSRAGDPSSSLRILTTSAAAALAAGDGASFEATGAWRAALCARCRAQGDADQPAVAEALQSAAAVLAAASSGDAAAVVACLRAHPGLGFLPLSTAAAGRCAADAGARLHPALQTLLPPLLIAAAEAMRSRHAVAAMGGPGARAQAVTALAAFAAAVRASLPPATYAQLARIEATPLNQ